MGCPHRGDGTTCWGCETRAKGIQYTTPEHRRNNLPPATPSNSWEKGVLRDERGLPILRGGKVIPIKQAAEQRHKIEAELRALRSGRDPAKA